MGDMPKEASLCSPSLNRRPLISAGQADALQSLFKLLANDTRLRILHALIRYGELCVTDLARKLEMKPQAVSNQLQRLSGVGMIAPCRRGNSIFYRVVNPCVEPMLDLALCLTHDECQQPSERPLNHDKTN
jgi:DNA-binding transcriptional ArsR family regulator